MASSDKNRRSALIYALIAVFCAAFAWIYEHFSHGVWSYPMVFAFAYPLIGGVLPTLAFGGEKPAGAGFWRAGLAALTVGSLFRGALEIFGTTHRLTVVYALVGGALCTIGAIQFVFDVLRFSRYNKTREPSDKEENTYEDYYHQP